MKYIITIDAGTTNTRAALFDENQHLIGIEKREIGVRNTAIDGNNLKLKQAVSSCIEGLMASGGIAWEDVDKILASGMITSNVGLVEIPHKTAPAGIQDLAAGITPVVLEDICPLPIHFIPGIKNRDQAITLENYEEMDIMRGEETESIAMLSLLPKGRPILLVLPGSHMKFVAVNAKGQVTGCLTSISGELLSVITNNTIIADAVDHRFVSPETYDKTYLLAGYRNAAAVGLGRACFSCRILNQFTEKNPDKLANYILGAVLESDVTALKHSAAIRAGRDTLMVVAGKEPLQTAIADILKEDGSFGDVQIFEASANIPLSSLGAFLIAKESGVL
jgi:2-dehydro-3-deoxygalactonokinase